MKEDLQVKPEGEQQRKKSRVQYNLNFPLPEVRSSLERDIKIMSAFVTASDFGQKFVGRKDVAQFTETNEQIVGGILTFFNKIGLAEKEGYTYKPSKELIDFENELKYEVEDVAGQALMPIILKTWFGEMAVKIFRSEGKPLFHEELFKRLGKMAGADPDYHKSAINHLVGYLKFSKLIIFNEESNTYSINLEKIVTDSKQQEKKVVTSDEAKKTNPSQDSSNQQQKGQAENPKHTIANISININLEIDNNTNPNQIAEIIKKVIEELRS